MTVQEKISKVQEIINSHFGVDISVKTRKREVVQARQFYYKWLKVNTNLSLLSMGKTLPLKQDHSTIHNALDAFEDNMDTYPQIDVEWDSVNEKIMEGLKTEKQKQLERAEAFNPS